MKYNLLPSAIVAKYAVEYSELVHEAVTIFKNSDEKWGVLQEITAGVFTILVEPVYNVIRIDDSGRLLVIKDDYMGLLDNRGETIIACSYVSLAHLQGDIFKIFIVENCRFCLSAGRGGGDPGQLVVAYAGDRQ